MGRDVPVWVPKGVVVGAYLDFNLPACAGLGLWQRGERRYLGLLFGHHLYFVGLFASFLDGVLGQMITLLIFCPFPTLYHSTPLPIPPPPLPHTLTPPPPPNRKLHPRNSNPSARPRRAPAGGRARSDVREDRHGELLGCVRGGETGAGGVYQWDGGGGVGGCWYVLFCYLWGGLGVGWGKGKGKAEGAGEGEGG